MASTILGTRMIFIFSLTNSKSNIQEKKLLLYQGCEDHLDPRVNADQWACADSTAKLDVWVTPDHKVHQDQPVKLDQWDCP